MKKMMLNIANDAKCAIGFSDSINWRAANMWTEKFCYYYSVYGDVDTAATYAKNAVISIIGTGGIDSMCVLSEGDV